MVLVDLFHKLVFRHRFGRVIYMPALVTEGSNSLRADVFKEEELKVLVFNGVKNFWLTDMHRGGAALSTEGITKGRGCWGDGNGYRGGRRKCC